jgi:hypothetical protein
MSLENPQMEMPRPIWDAAPRQPLCIDRVAVPP